MLDILGASVFLPSIPPLCNVYLPLGGSMVLTVGTIKRKKKKEKKTPNLYKAWPNGMYVPNASSKGGFLKNN